MTAPSNILERTWWKLSERGPSPADYNDIRVIHEPLTSVWPTNCTAGADG